MLGPHGGLTYGPGLGLGNGNGCGWQKRARGLPIGHFRTLSVVPDPKGSQVLQDSGLSSVLNLPPKLLGSSGEVFCVGLQPTVPDMGVDPGIKYSNPGIVSVSVSLVKFYDLR